MVSVPRRLIGVVAALVVTTGLLAQASFGAAPPVAGGNPDSELTGPLGCLGVVPSPSKRTKGGDAAVGLPLFDELAPRARDVACDRTLTAAAPASALQRWRLAHGTSTSNP